MLALKQKKVQQAKRVQPVSRLDAFFTDLGPLVSLLIARLMVWRAIHRRARERKERLKLFKVLHGGDITCR